MPASLISRSTACPNSSALYLRLRATLGLLAQIGNVDTSLGARRAVAHVDRAVFEALPADGDAQRNADQVGVRALLPGAGVGTVVQEDVPTGRVEGRRRLLGNRLAARQADDVDVVRRDRRRPDDALFVVALLHHGGHHASRPDAVGAHDQRLLLPVVVEEGRPQRRRVARVELEDVADLDRRLEAQCAAARRATIAFARDADVGEPRLEIAALLDAAEVGAGAVRAGDELAVAERL